MFCVPQTRLSLVHEAKSTLNKRVVALEQAIKNLNTELASTDHVSAGMSWRLWGQCVLPNTYVFTLWLSVLCMRSKAWLAALGLFAHAEVTQKHNVFAMGSKNFRYRGRPKFWTHWKNILCFL